MFRSADCCFEEDKPFFIFYAEEVPLSFLLVNHNVMITVFQNTLKSALCCVLGQLLTTGQ